MNHDWCDEPGEMTYPSTGDEPETIEEVMTKEELILALKALVESSPSEENHIEADGLLLQYINDQDIREAYQAIRKWYA